MDRESLAKQVHTAQVNIAESAITSPGMYQEYGRWKEAERDLADVKTRLADAKKKWAALIQPALSDPDFKAIAIKRGLIPND